MQKLILASGSPRRRVLMQHMGLRFDVVPSTFEEYLDDYRSPAEICVELGVGKVREVANRYPDAYVVGGDLIIVVDRKQLAKPAEAKQMLELISGRSHQAYGSLVLMNKSKDILETNYAVVQITFEPLPAKVIADYIATGDPYDKAGGYARRHPLLEPYVTIKGEANALTGLSTLQLRKMLTKYGFSIPVNEEDAAKILANSDLADMKILI